MRVELVQQAAQEEYEPLEMHASHADPSGGTGGSGGGSRGDMEDYHGQDYGQAIVTPSRAQAAEGRNPEDPSTWGRVGRNEPCPCGSGLKYKHCHGKIA